MRTLEGKVAVITGSTSSIGVRTATRARLLGRFRQPRVNLRAT